MKLTNSDAVVTEVCFSLHDEYYRAGDVIYHKHTEIDFTIIVLSGEI